MKRTVATIIVEPRTLLREGLAALLQGSNFNVIASLASPNELSRSSLRRASIVIIGVSNEPSRGWAWLEQVSSTARDYKILAVAEAAGETAAPAISHVFRWGVDGYILNARSKDVLLRALDLTVLGQKIVVLGQSVGGLRLSNATSGGFAVGSDNQSRAEALSGREREVLACVAEGKSNKSIAKNFRIADSTVKVHLRSILRKIRARNRAQAAVWAIQNSLGALGPSFPAGEAVEDGTVPELCGPGEKGQPEID